MNPTLHLVLGAAAIALAGIASAQDSPTPPANGTDAARQSLMDEAYRNHQAGSGSVARAEETTKRDARAAGHSFHQGVRATGHAIHGGVRATGHAIHSGVRATGHAIHRGVDKLTGK